MMTPVAPSTVMTVPQVERPAVNRIEAAVPLRCKGKLEQTVAEPSGPKVLQPFQKPVRFYDVYLDDLIYGRQGDWDEWVRHVHRLLHSIDDVFRPVDEQDSEYCKHVPSVKKLKKGDGYPGTYKIILGWLINVMGQTLELPPHRQQRLDDIFEYLRGRNCVGMSKWQKILGKLCSMSIGIPGSQGLFSLLQNEIKFVDSGRIRVTSHMRDQLDNFEHLAKSLK